MSLSREETARAKFTFSIYDFDGTSTMDAFQLGNALRAMGLCPSLKRISNLGGTIQRGEKQMKVEEFLAIYQEAKKDKEEGCVEDFVECLSSHDKDRCGKIHYNTLSHLLMGYGEEKLDRLETEEVIKDCGEPDDDGNIDYRLFLKNVIKGPDLKVPIAMLRATEDAEDSGVEFSRRDSADQKIASSSDRKASRSRQDDDISTTTDTLCSSVPTEKISRNADSDEDKVMVSAQAKAKGEKTATRIRQRKPENDNSSATSTPNVEGQGQDCNKEPEPEKQEEKKVRGSLNRRSRSAVSSSHGGADEIDERERSISPEDDDDISATSDTYQGDISRNSVKSGKSQGTNDREFSPDISSISDGDALSRKASRKSTGSTRSKKGSVADTSEASASSGLTSARGLLKSDRSDKPTSAKALEVIKSKQKKETEVKAKNQKPLISLATKGLFEKKK